MSRALAERLGLQVVSGFSLRRQLLGLSDADVELQRDYWLFDGAATRADEARLQGSTAEDDLDVLLLRRLQEGPTAVFDTWFLPWLATSAFSICLDIAKPVRIERIAKSLAESPDAVGRAVTEKDQRSARFARERYGVDIFADRTPFDVIIEVNREVEATAVLDLLNEVARLQFEGTDGADITCVTKRVQSQLLSRCPGAIREALVSCCQE